MSFVKAFDASMRDKYELVLVSVRCRFLGWLPPAGCRWPAGWLVWLIAAGGGL